MASPSVWLPVCHEATIKVSARAARYLRVQLTENLPTSKLNLVAEDKPEILAWYYLQVSIPAMWISL